MKSIIESIEQDYLANLKGKNDFQVSVLRMAKNALQNAVIASQKELDDTMAVVVLRREIKKREEAAKLYRDGGRAQAAQKEEEENAILKKYLPSEPDDDEIVPKIRLALKAVNAASPADMGKVMAKLLPEIGHSVDGSRLSQLVLRELKKPDE